MSWNRKNRYSGPTKTDLYWSQKYGAYALKWNDTFHFNEMTPIMNYIKTAPYGEWQYDPDNKIWYFMEKMLSNVRAMLQVMEDAGIFEVTFVEKPQNQISTVKFVSIDTYIDVFNKLTGVDVKGLAFPSAKKAYFRACMKLHPDKGNDSKDMSDLNVAWDAIKEEYFKQKKDVSYVND